MDTWWGGLLLIVIILLAACVCMYSLLVVVKAVDVWVGAPYGTYTLWLYVVYSIVSDRLARRRERRANRP